MLTIPGVEITVVKELVPRSLGAAGVLGIVGPCENANKDQPLREVNSLGEFKSVFGAGSVASMPEVALAFTNGLKSLICAALPASAGAAAMSDPMFDLVSNTAATQSQKLTVKARANGTWGNDIFINLATKGTNPSRTVDVFVYTSEDDMRADKPAEAFRNLSPDVSDSRFFMSVVNTESGLIKMPATEPFFALGGSIAPQNTSTPTRLSGGIEPGLSAYSDALDRLETQTQIDMVIASNRYTIKNDARSLYASVIAHCEKMSRKAGNRIGLGQIMPHGTDRPDMVDAAAMANVLSSDRFILSAPCGYVGGVAGLLSSLKYFQAPTFKTLRGISAPNFDFAEGDLRTLLNAGVLPIDTLPRKGVAVVKGHSTSQFQINVQRTADRAVRTVQNIAIDYIGLLNTQAQRSALRQRIDEAFTAMTREGALVPSADGLSPPFVVEVTSSNADAAAGIVRIGIAVRPVRAIDFIYATINVLAF